jgi:hypothetical protein
MMHCYPVGLALLSGILALLCVRPALAEGTACSALRIELDSAVSARFPDLLGRVREALDARDDLDRCAQIQLSARGASIVVQVSLPDGRSTARSVSGRDDLVPTLESLLLVPSRGEQPEALAAARPAHDVATAPSAPAPLISPRAGAGTAPSPRPSALGRERAGLDRGAFPAGSAHPRSHLRIDLSVLSGARIGDGQGALGFGVFSFLELSRWLLGLGARADHYRLLSGAEPDGAALELALLAGTRFRSHHLALDLTAGPAAVLQGTATFERQTASGDFKASSSSTVPRLLLGARLNFNARATLHPFVGVDGELGPRRANDGGAVPQVSYLPLWTLGLALGASVGTE